MIKQISIKNRSGHILRGILNLPEENGTFPVWMNIHGFGGNKSGYKNLHTKQARTFEKNGIVSVRFDLYGNGESDGEFEDMTFTSLLEDTEDIYRWVLEQEWADKEQVILSGQSMGGYVASCAAPKLKPAKLVLMCPGGGMWYGAKERALAMEEQGIFFADIEGLKFSTAFNKDLDQYEPFSAAAGYEGPVLLIRGTEDQLVDEAMCEKYRALYADCTYVQVEGGNHNFSSIPASEECEKAILDFIK